MDALRAGTLGSNRQPMSDDDIKKIRHSKQWKSRYDKYLRKVFRSEAEIYSYLDRWIQTWDGHEDSCSRRIFSSATIKATREQMRKVKYVLDSKNATIYSPVPPSQDSPHNLTVWRTNRPESSLEKFHEHLAHFGNGADVNRGLSRGQTRLRPFQVPAKQLTFVKCYPWSRRQSRDR